MRFSIYALLALLTTADAVIGHDVPRSTFVTACNATLPDGRSTAVDGVEPPF
jgi:hypothetical protein